MRTVVAFTIAIAFSAWTVGSTSVVVDGVKLRVNRTGGDGSPVVLMHGITDSGLCWSRLTRDLEAGYDIVMVDERGHGESAHPGSYSFAEHVNDLTGVIDALELEQAVLVGHSMSGPHVGAAPAARPNLVRALAVVDPHWPFRPETSVDYDITAVRRNRRR